MGRALLASVPSLQAQARPEACCMPGTTHLGRAVPGPWRAMPAGRPVWPSPFGQV